MLGCTLCRVFQVETWPDKALEPTPNSARCTPAAGGGSPRVVGFALSYPLGLPKDIKDKMTYPLLCWLFVAAITIHNMEEALLLPRWSQSAGRWHHPVGEREFRFAVSVLTALAYIAAVLSVVGGKETVGSYFIAGYALAMLANVFFPHLLATLVMRRYAPGTATALLLNLPVTVLLLYQGFQQGYIRLPTFLWAGPVVVAAILASIPLLFSIGRFTLGVKGK